MPGSTGAEPGPDESGIAAVTGIDQPDEFREPPSEARAGDNHPLFGTEEDLTKWRNLADAGLQDYVKGKAR